ncbi:hypothetical protein CHCC14817_1448 [Bacillus paralicheniformis]|nr:hypothetical protein SC10_B2orf06496 [Bacillus paralicheniformis]TWM00492.1 hypothetical protein CHCC15136_2908 [Bacillus paralicheniformis]TWM46787.1 hypothetical protein CHCC14817_1448 [Bacillus paralicheniformis]TWN68581.1 hypothetical protein CHCC12620_4532 [Bacillus paralicheniformis]
MKHLPLQDRLYSNVFFFGRVTGLPFFPFLFLQHFISLFSAKRKRICLKTDAL